MARCKQHAGPWIWGGGVDTAASDREGSLPLGHRRGAFGQWGETGWGEQLPWEPDSEWAVQLHLESELVSLLGWHQVELCGHEGR